MMSERIAPPDLKEICQRLAQAESPVFWRSLEEAADSDAFREARQREVPQVTGSTAAPINRRRFLQLTAASLSLAGLAACTGRADRHIIPYVEAPEELVPGNPLFFATAHLLGGYATGILAKSEMGRPIKIEGNPHHPASLGASDIFAQASILSLYDPSRSQEVIHDGRTSSWVLFEAALAEVLAQSGVQLRLLTPTITSPTLNHQFTQLLRRFPRARLHQYEPINWDNAYEGARQALGQEVQPVYRFEQADVILALDADFLATYPGCLRYTHDFSRQRTVAGTAPESASMNRLYSVSSTPTLTSTMADHSWPLRPEEIERFARLVAQQLGIGTTATDPSSESLERIAELVARDLAANSGRSLVLAGMAQPPAVHALAHAINEALGNVGETLYYIEPVPLNADSQVDSLRQLVDEMAAGEVDVLLILDGNPAYTAPVDMNFAGALEHVPFSAHLGLYADETSLLCTWHLPQTHYLEAWSDARAYDGTATIMQPLIAPLYDSRSPHELLAFIAGGEQRDPYRIIHRYWQEHIQADGFDTLWRIILKQGVIPDSHFPPVDVTWNGFTPPPPASNAAAATAGASALVVIFRPDPCVWDGQFSSNAWLQELPKPFTKLTWDNAALIPPALAAHLELAAGDIIRLQYNGYDVLVPVFLLPGQAPGCITLHLGYGRPQAIEAGNGGGVNVYRIRPADGLWSIAGIDVEKTGATYALATTQQHYSMNGRELVRVTTLSDFRQNAAAAGETTDSPPSLYPEGTYDGYKWGMSINLNTCTGCQACIIACQAENNIPVVGKEGVQQGREMHWLRVDDYFAGNDLEAPRIYHQPVPCMHCEMAPCEPVCPVAATTHSAEGLNEMTYNRCIGTRYCSNNCPYKVRRFNFFDYAVDDPLSNLLYNPDVTVRTRGVMEKCTYCVQRINRARNAAQREGRSLGDGEVVTACQQACPAQAIIFGNMNDGDSRVSHLKAQPHDYGLLAELGTRPRTTYLARVLNVNEEITE